MIILKQSTGGTLKIGPFLDESDGKTTETGLTIPQSAVRLTKLGGNFAQKDSGTAASHDEFGWYDVPYNGTDANTVGPLIVAIHGTGALPVWREFQVVEEDTYEFLMASGATPDADHTTIKNYVTAILADTGTAGVALADYTITALKIGTDAIGAAEIAANAIGASEIAADAIDLIWDEATSGHVAAGTFGELGHLIVASGTVETSGSNSSTQVQTTLAEATDNHYDVMTILFTSGAEAGQSRLITSYTGATGVIGWNAALTGTPADSVSFVIITSGTTADAVWDELLTGSSHNIATSAGRRLRQIEQAFVHANGTIAAVTDGHTFTLDAGAVATAGYYVGDRLQIAEGTGAGQSRLIAAYTSGRVVTLDSDFTTNPDTSSLYEIDAADVHVSLSDADLAEGFVAVYTNTTTITLDAGAVATADFYNGEIIVFTHGTGKGQAREITGYTSGRVVTMSPALTTAVDTTTTYHIQVMVSIPEIVDEVWDEAQSDHVIAGSMGALQRGYAHNSIWIDTVNGAAGTTDYVNGTVDNPVSSIGNANTLAASLGISRFEMAPGSSITLAAAQANQVFHGEKWTLALGGQNVAGSTFIGAIVSGVMAGTGVMQKFVDCVVNATSVIKGTLFVDCQIANDITVVEAGEFLFRGCASSVAGAGAPTFDFGTALNSSNLSVRRHSGGWKIDYMGAGTGTYNASFEGHGQIIWQATCSATSNASIRGHWKITDNASGAVTETFDDTISDLNDIQSRIPAALSSGNIKADALAISTSTAAADNLEASAETIVTGAAEAGTLSTTEMTTDLTEATDDHYNGRVVIWTSGVLANQASDITDYLGSTGKLTYTAVTEAPSAADTFVIV